MMHQSEFDAANVALSRAADKRKSLINIHKNWYTATLRWRVTFRPCIVNIIISYDEGGAHSTTQYMAMA